MSHAANKYVKHLVQSPNGDPLSIGEKLVLTQLADDHNEDRRQAWPSIPHLAGRACMSVRNCRRLLRSLERKGVLETCLQLRAGNDGQTSNAYRFPAIDPPFDTHVVATTRKRMELRRSANERARSAQLQLETPPDAGVRGSAASVAVAHAPAAFVREGRTRTSGGGGHGRPGAPDTGVRGNRTLTEPSREP